MLRTVKGLGRRLSQSCESISCTTCDEKQSNAAFKCLSELVDENLKEYMLLGKICETMMTVFRKCSQGWRQGRPASSQVHLSEGSLGYKHGLQLIFCYARRVSRGIRDT